MRVVIIGNGVTGVTAAIRLREKQPDWDITIVSGESTHHYSRPALMYLFMGHMTYRDTKPYEDDFWARQRLRLVRDWVTRIDTENRRLELHRGGPLPWDKLLIATGSKSNRFGWPGQDLPGVQGLYDLRDVRLLYENSKEAHHAVIVGGGLIGIELGEMLHSRGIAVTFLIREGSYWNNILPPEESEMVSRHITDDHRMTLVRNTNLQEIVDDGTGRVRGIVTDAGDRVDCQIVGLTPGVSPNIDLVKEAGTIETAGGVLVDDALRTNVDGVWSAGDCAEIVKPGEERNLLQQVWYTGKMQARTAADSIAGADVRYDPGIWYNSAKFLDIEYQVYGDVRARPNEGETFLFWGHRGGRKSLRLVEKDGRFRGLLVMGMRYRHRECESWIRDAIPTEQAIDRLADATFDPEFHETYVGEIRDTLLGQRGGAAKAVA